MILQTKANLRHQLNERRQAVSASTRQQASLDATNIFMQTQCFANSRHVACYAALNHEISCAYLIAGLWQTSKHCYLPIVDSTLGELQFSEYLPNAELRNNRFLIAEPVPPHQTILPQALDIIILPTVGFDFLGNRIGTGGGYYDKTLARLAPEQRPLLIGLAYACQAATWQADPWDIRLDGILTEKDFTLFKTRPRDDV